MSKQTLILALALATAVPSPRTSAQDKIDPGAPRTTIVSVEPAREAAPDSYMPAPPPSALEERQFNKHAIRVVPNGGEGLPLPTSAEVRPVTQQPQSGPSDFKYFVNRPVQPTGAGISGALVEPAGANNRDVAFYTGNTFAALSRDSGQSWTHINPSTRFTAPDGPMCCDQRVLHVPSPNMTIWLLEYRYSAAAGTGSLRIAYAKGRNDLWNNRFDSFVVNPRTFGFGNGFFLDYSDIAYSTKYLYGSAIVAPGGSTGNISYVLWRADLQDVYNGGNVAITYYTGAQLGGLGNYRFAQGSKTTMHWAAHESTSVLRVYRWRDTATAPEIFRKTVSRWSTVPTPAPGPDNRDWTSFRWTNNCVLGGYGNGSEIGFLWTSGSISGRPRNFVRVARFRTSDLALIGQRDIWSSATAYHFPYASTNSRGDVGVTICYGGGASYPSAAAFIIDDITSWAQLRSIHPMATGKAGPATNRWGDYFHCGRSSNQPTTWVGMGFTKQTAIGSAQPRYVWFGRERDQPRTVTLNVRSTPVSNIPVTVPELDLFARGDGRTNLTRSYPQNQGYRLTVPERHVVGNATYVFRRWRINNSPRSSRTLTVSSIGTAADTAIADYDQVFETVVQSRNPASNVRVTTSVADVNGRTFALTGGSLGTLRYKSGQIFVLTAPASTTVGNFHRWVLNGVDQPIGRRTLNLSANRVHTARADFCRYDRGTFTSYGSGCPGTGDLVPTHSGAGRPDVGRSMSWRVTRARPNSPAILNVGATRQNLDLTPFGAAGCFWHVQPFVLLSLSTTAIGAASVPVTLSTDTGFIGVRLYTQYAIVDPGTKTSLKVVLSNGLETKIGGQVCN